MQVLTSSQQQMALIDDWCAQLDENRRSMTAAWSGQKGDDLMRFVICGCTGSIGIIWAKQGTLGTVYQVAEHHRQLGRASDDGG